MRRDAKQALIGSTHTTTGLKVICVRDDTEYQLAQKVSDDEFTSITIDRLAPFENWNYRILPKYYVEVIV